MLLTLETTVYLKGPGDFNYNRLFDSQTVSFGPLSDGGQMRYTN